MQFFSLCKSRNIHRVYNSIDSLSAGIVGGHSGIQNKSLGVIVENDSRVAHILEDNEQESLAYNLSDVTMDMIRQTREVPLLLKIKQDTYISVVSTSVLENGDEVFTVRYGITTESKFPEFSGLSLLIRNKNGTFFKQEVVTQSESRSEFENYGEQLITALGGFHQELLIFPESRKLKLDTTMMHEGNCDIYGIGHNYELNPVYILNISNPGDSKVGLQCELRKFHNGESATREMNSIYIGSMIKGSEISIGESLLRVISERKALGIEDDWKVYFFRDDSHSKESKVRTVKQYKKLFPSH